ncbi:MAG TPA: hypothetical protein VMU95_14045 [Trebonia sp.]|nr:hypothetical protein [Trebonia sp.]
MGGALTWGSAAIAVPVVAALGIALTACGAGAARHDTSSQSARQRTRCSVQAGKAVDGVTLSPVQLGDARTIYGVSVTMQLPGRAAVIAIATSMQESSLLNEPYGTSDSLGLFQQRPSEGWGTPAQIMDPIYASTRFYQALALVPAWDSLPLTIIAQEVQGSGYPGAYAKWEPLADALVATFDGTATECGAGRETEPGQPGSRA